MNFEMIAEKAKDIFAKASFEVKKHAPEILMGVGTVSIAAGTVLACKGTIKAIDIVKEHKEGKEIIETVSSDKDLCEEKGYTEEDRRRDTVQLYISTAVKLIRTYALPASFLVGGIACMFSAFGIVKSINASLAAAYASLTSAYDAYRKRVEEAVGEEKENDIFSGLKEIEVGEEKTGENGKKKLKKEKVKAFGDDCTYSRFARFFDETNDNWSRSAENNLIFLRGQQEYFQRRLHARGVIFLNEVYEALGIPLSKEGTKFGWVDDGKTFVNFGIYSGYKAAREFVNGYNPAILLDFNVRDIYNDIERYENI